MPLENDLNNELLAMLRAGDSQAIEILFNQYSTRLHGIVNRIIGDPETAKDLLQEIFYRLWKKREELQILSIEPYLVRVSVNEALAYLRRGQSGHRLVTLNEVTESRIKIHTDPDRGLEYSELEVLIKTAIASMPPQRRAVFTLSRFEHMSYAEIAKALDISEKSVEKHIARALTSLRTALAPYLRFLPLFLLPVHAL